MLACDKGKKCCFKKAALSVQLATLTLSLPINVTAVESKYHHNGYRWEGLWGAEQLGYGRCGEVRSAQYMVANSKLSNTCDRGLVATPSGQVASFYLIR